MTTTLPMKYKAMLFASISFINTYVIDETAKEELLSKLPIYNSVDEQMAYFDIYTDMKTIEQTIYKPMLQLHKKKEKDASKPVKAPKEPTTNFATETIEKLSGGFTNIISKTDLDKHNLGWAGGNGIGSRWRGGYYNYQPVYGTEQKNSNGCIYSEDLDDVIPAIVLSEFLKKNKDSSKGIIGIYIFSIRAKTKSCRPIKEDIAKKVKIRDIKCVQCGTSSTLVCDHKNDLYNDDRVLNINTQTESDFQLLCTHCNLQKRQICKEEKDVGKIYSAKEIKRYQEYRFEFPWEKKVFDQTDINCKTDTYWFDPVEFDSKIYRYVSYVLPIINEIKRLNRK